MTEVHHPDDQEGFTDVVRAGSREVAENASILEQAIVDDIQHIRSCWVALAAKLHVFAEHRCWEQLGYDSLELWLAGPDIEIRRTNFFELVETHRQLRLERGISAERLQQLDVSKVQAVLPAIRRGHVSADVALADCEALTRTDLREKYARHPSIAAAGSVEGRPIAPDDFHYEKCKECGQKVRVYDGA